MNHIAYTPLQRPTTTYPDLHPLQRPTTTYPGLHPLQRPTTTYHDLHPLQALSLWLDRRSATFTRIAGFAVSRRSVIRVHALIVSLAIGVVSLFQAPYLSLASFITAAWLTYRINKTPKSENNNE